MKIEGNPKSQGPDSPRRFSARKAAAGEGGKSFGEALKKAAAGLPGPAAGIAPAAAAFPAADAVPAAPESAKAPAGNPSETGTGRTAKEAKADSDPASFEDHMEMVRLRLKSGYYTSKNIDEALSDRLTGYFDELA